MNPDKRLANGLNFSDILHTHRQFTAKYVLEKTSFISQIRLKPYEQNIYTIWRSYLKTTDNVQRA
jgi:hypothetical protein